MSGWHLTSHIGYPIAARTLEISRVRDATAGPPRASVLYALHRAEHLSLGGLTYLACATRQIRTFYV